MATFQPSEIVENTKAQVVASLKMSWLFEGKSRHNPKSFTYIQMDVNTLRVHKGLKSVDITYNVGTDLYDCKVHKTNRSTFECKTETFDGVFVENLINLF